MDKEEIFNELVEYLKESDFTRESVLDYITQYIVDNFNRKQEPYTVKQEGKV